MNPLAKELNEIIMNANPNVYQMLSKVGKRLFFPKGILYQSAEAKEKAHRFNATIGMAIENNHPMFLPSIMEKIDLEPEKAVTYAPATGVQELRNIWKEFMYKKNPSLKDKKISLPIVTSAITHGLSVIADIWIDPGDIIILPDKMWGNYNLIFSVRKNAHIFTYPLFENNKNFNLKAFSDILKKLKKQKDKLIIILNFPNNPTGYSPSIKEAKEIASILIDMANKGTNIILISDDAYFGLIYEENILKESIFGYLTGEHPKLLSIKLDAATKEDFVWGFRIGFLTYGSVVEGKNIDIDSLYNALEKKTAGAIRASISNANHLGQEILLNAFKANNYLLEKQQKINILKRRAQEIKRIVNYPKYKEAWEVYPFNSGYFMCIKLKTVNAEKLRMYLLEKYGIGLISLNDKDLRIAFSCVEEKDISSLFDIIYKAIKELEK